MANTVAIPRGLLIYGICLPLAVLLGYLLADPFESGTIAVLVLVVAVLIFPVLLKWHHALLIFICNADVLPFFIPGRPMMWMLMSAVSTFLLLLDRSMGQRVDFFRARNLSFAFLTLGIIVFLTAYVTGGIGLAVFGARSAGGKRYFYIFLGIALYFALSTIPIKRKYAGFATGVFFLSSLTGLVGYIAALGGPGFNFLVELFPIEGILDETTPTAPSFNSAGIVRLSELAAVSTGLFCYVMARYGVRGTLDLARPWRLCLFFLAVVATLYSGFRSGMILFLIVFGIMFYMEGLFSTRLFPGLVLAAILVTAVLLPFVQKLPLPVQRTLCFLPITVDPIVRRNAEDSTDWRLDMWQEVVPTIPRYLIRGKGYSMDPDDIFMLESSRKNGYTTAYAEAIVAGDYHSGPLSVIIPFGVFGAATFIWILIAALKVLRLNYRFGDPSLQSINMFLLAYFVARIIFFIFVFGSLYSDLALFAGLVGLSVSLNHGVAQPEPQPAIEPRRFAKSLS